MLLSRIEGLGWTQLRQIEIIDIMHRRYVFSKQKTKQQNHLDENLWIRSSHSMRGN
jgi:hypothetical protein